MSSIALLTVAGLTGVGGSPARAVVADALGAVSSGTYHSCAVDSSGAASCWGSNDHGRLGIGVSGGNQLLPVPVLGLQSGVRAISAGRDSTCAVLDSGGLKCWGQNDVGQLGNGTFTDSLVPVDVMGLTSGVVDVRVTQGGTSDACALMQSGGVKCWGEGGYGNLGNGAYANSNVPVDVAGLSSGVASISVGGAESCAVTTSGAAKCWGTNDFGALGDGGPETRSALPVDVAGLSSGVASLSVGGSGGLICALTAVGGVKCWGWGDYPGLPGGTLETTPIDVSGLTTGVRAIASSGGHQCVVTAVGGVKCWGDNTQGQVGAGTGTLEYVNPVAAVGLTSGVHAIDASINDTCAIRDDGAKLCWGRSVDGQVGDGTTRPATSPTPVGGLNAVPLFATITKPVDGDSFVVGQTVNAAFSCSGFALTTCTGDVGDGAPLDTSTLGQHTFTASASDGTQTVSVTHSYTVTLDDQPPAISILSPSDGATFAEGSTVNASYHCSDPASGIASCTGSVADGSPIDTTAGTHTFTVTATDASGNSSTATRSYFVGSAPPSCPSPRSGAWIGTWSSAVIGARGSFQSDFTFVGSTMTGSMTLLTGSSVVTSGNLASGSASCETLAGTVAGTSGPVTFTGTVSPDGTEIIGAYGYGSDSGTWRAGWVQQTVETTGSSLTTDTGGGATATTPVQATVNSPTPGPLSIGQTESAGMTLSGFYLLGQVVHIVAPPATPTAPLSFSFELDASLTGGVTASSVVAFRNGVAVPDCTGGQGQASPDPCVSSRTDLPNGNVRLSVLSSNASVWALGVSKAISIGSASLREGDTGGPRTISFPVTLSVRPTTTVSVHYTVESNGSATGANKPTAGADFQTKSGTVTFKAGTTTTKFVAAAVFPDTNHEGDETFRVVLSNPTGGYALGGSEGTGTILDDDPGTGLRAGIGDASVWEGNDGKVNPVKVLVSLSDPATTPVSVNVSVTDGSATGGSDFKSVPPKTLTFLAGQRLKVVTVMVLPDTQAEGNQTFTVTLTNPVPAGALQLDRSVATVTILDDD